jgi:hypothetical protein
MTTGTLQDYRFAARRRFAPKWTRFLPSSVLPARAKAGVGSKRVDANRRGDAYLMLGGLVDAMWLSRAPLVNEIELLNL